METQSKTIKVPVSAADALLQTLMSEVGSFESPDTFRQHLADMMEGYISGDLDCSDKKAVIFFAFRRLDNIIKLIGYHSQSVKVNNN